MATATAAPPSTEATLPHPEFKKSDRLKIVIANVEQNVRSEAIEAANKRLSDKLGEGNGFNRFLKGIWYGNTTREFYLNKYSKEAEAQIRESGDLHYHKGGSADTNYEVVTTRRLTAEYDDLLHKSEDGKKGDSRRLIEDFNEDGSPNPEGMVLKHEIFGLIEQFADGTLSDAAAFEEEKKRVVNELIRKGLSPDYLHDAMLYTDNLLQIAQNVKAMVNHEKGVVGSVLSDKEIAQEILEKADVFVAEANVGAHTEVEYTTFERISKKLESVPLVPEVALAAAYSLTTSLTKSAIGSATRFGAFSVGAGALAALREKRALKEERAFLGRRLATGEADVSALAGRTKELQEASIEGKTSESLKDQIGVLYDPSGKLKITDKNSFEEALQIIAESQSRMRLSVDMGLDFIWGTDVSKQELEELILKARCDLFEFIEGATDDELKALGVEDADIPKLRGNRKEALEFVLEPKIKCYEDVLIHGDEEVRGVKQADRAYNELQIRKMAKAFIAGAMLSGAAALIGQEGLASASANQQGLAENVVGIDHGTDATSETLLEGLLDNPRPEAFIATDTSPSFNLPNEDIIKVPEGFSATTETDGTLTVTGPDNLRVENLALTSEGTLSAAAANQLEEAGFKWSAHAEQLTIFQSEEFIATPNDYLKNHAEDTMRVTRDFFMDNGSPLRPNGTELNLHYDGINENGNYVVRLSGLDEVATTSANGEQILVGEALANDKMDLQISLDKGTQTNVISVDFNLQGIAEIPPQHSSLFNMDGGVLKSNAQYVEASYMGEMDANGVTHVQPIATDVGEARGTFNDIKVTEQVKDVTTYKFSYEPPAIDREVDTPIVVPLYSRQGPNMSPRPTPNPVGASAPTPGAPGSTQPFPPPPSPSSTPPGAPGNPGGLGTPPGPGAQATSPGAGTPTASGTGLPTGATAPGAGTPLSAANPGAGSPGSPTDEGPGNFTDNDTADTSNAATGSNTETPTGAPTNTGSKTEVPNAEQQTANGGVGNNEGANTQETAAEGTNDTLSSVRREFERLQQQFANFGQPAQPPPRTGSPPGPTENKKRNRGVSKEFVYDPTDRRPFYGVSRAPSLDEQYLIQDLVFHKLRPDETPKLKVSYRAQSLAQQAIDFARSANPRSLEGNILRLALVYLLKQTPGGGGDNGDPIYKDAMALINNFRADLFKLRNSHRSGAGRA